MYTVTHKKGASDDKGHGLLQKLEVAQIKSMIEKNCIQKKLAMKDINQTQQKICFATESIVGIASITNFQYDHAKVSELASHMILAHECPFAVMEHAILPSS